MKLIVCAVGHRMPAWVAAGFQEYASRMPRESLIDLIEIRPETRPAKASGAVIDKLLAAEAKRMLAVLPDDCYHVALDERGQALSSAQLARSLAEWMRSGRDVAFLIGSADGLASTLKQQAALTLSLSAMTLPHHLVRVLLAEQLYRAACMLNHHPYHRA
jgi:23S rRNA (pseudouridine1915-N3)-methyltransferase